MQPDGLQRMLDFLEFLRQRKVVFFLTQYSDDGITVTLTLVGKRIEVEFFVDHVEFSVFEGSEAVQSDEKALRRLIRQETTS